VSLVVTCNFFKTISTTFHGEQIVHLKGVLGSGQLNLINGVSEGIKSVESNCEQISRVRASSLNVDTEETGVSKVSINSLDAINETVLFNSLVSSSGVS
jgi:hypothetical protein